MKQSILTTALILILSICALGQVSQSITLESEVGGLADKNHDVVVVDNNYAFIASGWTGLIIADSSVPGDITIIDRILVQGELVQVELNENYLYGLLKNNDLVVFDVSDINNVQLIDRVNCWENSQYSGTQSIQVFDNKLYCQSYEPSVLNAQVMRVFDLSQQHIPENYSELVFTPEISDTPFEFHVNQMGIFVIQNDYLFRFLLEENTLQFQNTHHIPYYFNGSLFTPSSESDFMYCFDRNNLKLIDYRTNSQNGEVSNVANMLFSSQFPGEIWLTIGRIVTGNNWYFHYGYLVETGPNAPYGENFVVEVDISDPSNPVFQFTSAPEEMRDFYYFGGTQILTGSTKWVSAYSLEDCSYLGSFEFYNRSDFATIKEIDGDDYIIRQEGYNITVYSDPEDPELIEEYVLPNSEYRVGDMDESSIILMNHDDDYDYFVSLHIINRDTHVIQTVDIDEAPVGELDIRVNDGLIYFIRPDENVQIYRLNDNNALEFVDEIGSNLRIFSEMIISEDLIYMTGILMGTSSDYVLNVFSVNNQGIHELISTTVHEDLYFYTETFDLVKVEDNIRTTIKCSQDYYFLEFNVSDLNNVYLNRLVEFPVQQYVNCYNLQIMDGIFISVLPDAGRENIIFDFWYLDENDEFQNVGYFYDNDFDFYETSSSYVLFHSTHASVIASFDENTLDVKQQNTDSSTLPNEFILSDPYPNPFNPSTSVDVYLPEVSNLTVKVYDLLGREVAVLLQNQRIEGSSSLTFNASGFGSGLYFMVAESDKFGKAVQKLMLVK